MNKTPRAYAHGILMLSGLAGSSPAKRGRNKLHPRADALEGIKFGNNKNILAIAFVALVFGGGGFLGGMKYQQSKPPSRFSNFNGRSLVENVNGNENGNIRLRGNQNFRPVNGEIIARDEESITVRMANGSSRIILLSESTSLLKSSSGSKEDLRVGETVMVVGTENPDGSVTAQNVQINPPFRNQNNSVQGE